MCFILYGSYFKKRLAVKNLNVNPFMFSILVGYLFEEPLKYNW